MPLAYVLVFAIVFVASSFKNLVSADVHTTIVPINSLVSMITKDVDNSILITENSSLHHNELSYKQIKMLKTAKVIVLLSKDFEYDVYKQINTKNTIVIEAINAPNLHTLKVNDSKYIDYHVWHSPYAFIAMLHYVADELSVIYPDNAHIYKKNADEYSKIISSIDNEIKHQFTNFDKKVMFFHNAWQYYSLHYNIDVVGTVITETGLHTHGFAMSNKQILDLLNTAKQNGVSCIFIEPEYNFKDFNKLLNEQGIKTLMLDPMESYSASNKNYISFYLDTLKQNSKIIIGC